LGLGRYKKISSAHLSNERPCRWQADRFLPPAFDLHLEPSEEIRGVIACDQLVVLAIDDPAVAALGD
jgi:hypothetical protein